VSACLCTQLSTSTHQFTELFVDGTCRDKRQKDRLMKEALEQKMKHCEKLNQLRGG
jgi:hypothetical protein